VSIFLKNEEDDVVAAYELTTADTQVGTPLLLKATKFAYVKTPILVRKGGGRGETLLTR
jgi:hypothetical protein